MYKNPGLVKKYRDEVEALERELSLARQNLFCEKYKVPDGYKLLVEGDIVAKDAVSYEPCHGTWQISGGNSIGKRINENGFVTGIVHRGWQFANPL